MSNKPLQIQSVVFDTVLSEHSDLTVYTPKLPGDDWVYFGPVATSSVVSERSGLIAKVYVADAVADVAHWELVFSDISGAFSIWRGIPDDPRYVTIGDVLVNGMEKPTAEQVAGIKAIHRDLVGSLPAQRKVWENQAPQVSIWDLVALPLILVSTGAFVASPEQGPVIHAINFHSFTTAD